MRKLFQTIVSSKLKLFLVSGLLSSLVVTISLFAYAYTVASTSLTVSSGAQDFANISANNTVASYTLFGSHRGQVGAGNLFNFTPTSGYTGDLQVNVYLANPDELSKNYGLWMIRVRMVDASDNPMDKEGLVKVLSLNNGVVSFITDNFTAGTTYFIKTTGGVYRAFPWVYLTGKTIYNPSLYTEVLQAGL